MAVPVGVSATEDMESLHVEACFPRKAGILKALHEATSATARRALFIATMVGKKKVVTIVWRRKGLTSFVGRASEESILTLPRRRARHPA